MTKPLTEKTPVWRYMSFGRFVWLLKSKALWMTRVDQLHDQWEMRYSSDEIDAIMRKQAAFDGGLRIATLRDEFLRGVDDARRWMYVNCWTASTNESGLMWRVYSKSEGVAVQTTYERLKRSVLPRVLPNLPPAEVRQVKYVKFRPDEAPRPASGEILIRKRPEFESERECRILMPGFGEELGFALPWDPEEHVRRVFVHPEADTGFLETVEAVVHAFAPALRKAVRFSRMRDSPAKYPVKGGELT